jgi:outer membrane protein OmpA-like peptidoglycan-associated protein
MSASKLKIIENMILIAFPAALFVGCAGSDIKPSPDEKNTATYSVQQNTVDNISPRNFGSAEVLYFNPSETITNNVFGPKSPAIEGERSVENSQSEQMEGHINETKAQDTQKNTGSLPPKKKLFFFDTNKHALSDAQQDELRQHANYLKTNPAAILVINGHADVRGSESYNQSLSEKRTLEAYQILAGLGVEKNQLVTRSFGELIPLHADNNWDENRRIELEYADPMILTSM